LKTKQCNLRMNPDVVEWINTEAQKDSRTPGIWLSLFLQKHIGKPKKALKAKEEPISFDSWPYIPSHELITAWLKTKKAAKGSISQLAIDTVGKELHKAQQNGFTVEECLCDAENGKWKGFKASWMKRPEDEKSRRNTEPSSEADKVRAACEAKRNSRGEREINGETLGEDGGALRLQVHETIRPDTGRDLDLVHEGSFWSADGNRP